MESHYYRNPFQRGRFKRQTMNPYAIPYYTDGFGADMIEPEAVYSIHDPLENSEISQKVPAVESDDCDSNEASEVMDYAVSSQNPFSPTLTHEVQADIVPPKAIESEQKFFLESTQESIDAGKEKEVSNTDIATPKPSDGSERPNAAFDEHSKITESDNVKVDQIQTTEAQFVAPDAIEQSSVKIESSTAENSPEALDKSDVHATTIAVEETQKDDVFQFMTVGIKKFFDFLQNFTQVSLLSMTKKSSVRAEPIIKQEKYRPNDRKDYYRSVNSNDDTIVIVKSPSFPIKVAYDKPKVNLFQKLREKRRQVNHVPSQRFIKPTLSYQLSNPFKLFNSIEKWRHPNGYTKDNYMYQKIAKDDPIVGTKTEVVQDVLQLVKNLAINILWEVTAGQMGRAPDVVTDTLGASTSKEEAEEVDDDKELEEMKNRLQSLRS
ncbi:unnamed protein product [Trichogramma brassicae]|uniref:Uncharacterized protein n=1 Tax=Trichogramma brassicae TaxID=86971 RepID=A0A6H5I8B5_9HYME|nr:unnamed protein product [Trichogramma brassicae]